MVKLVEREFAVRNVSAGEAVVFFEIERGDDAAREDFRGQIGAYCASVFTTTPAKASRWLAQSPLFNL